MAFNIKNDRADELLRELTELTGESLTAAVTESLRERLERQRRLRSMQVDVDPLNIAIDRFRSVVRAGGPTDDEILGYDEHGLPA